MHQGLPPSSHLTFRFTTKNDLRLFEQFKKLSYFYPWELLFSDSAVTFGNFRPTLYTIGRLGPRAESRRLLGEPSSVPDGDAAVGHTFGCCATPRATPATERCAATPTPKHGPQPAAVRPRFPGVAARAGGASATANPSGGRQYASSASRCAPTAGRE